jgi:hypothetical protein
MNSAARPRTENVSQNIFRSKRQVYSLWVRDSSMPFWKFWECMNLLSLDAPLLALVWQDFLARCYPSLLRPAGRWVLGLTVWVIYIADRLIDVRSPAVENEPIRHRFYRQNRGLAKVVLTSVAFADLFIGLLWLRPAVFSNGLLIGAGVVCYLAVFPFSRIAALIRWKRPCAALLFTTGIFLVAWTGTVNPWPVLGEPALAFCALCLGNMMLIEWWEQGRFTARGWVWMVLLASLCALPGQARWYAAVAAAAIGLAAVDLYGGKLSRDARALLADMLLFTPLLFR